MTTWHDVIGEEKEKEYFKKVRLLEKNEVDIKFFQKRKMYLRRLNSHHLIK